MGLKDTAKKAATTAAAFAAVVNVTKNDMHNEVDAVRLAGIPLFTRDTAGNPYLFGFLKLKRRRGPRAG